ncbi:MAG: carboxypeptidase-like regulatory domain-containing protein [Planctomycetota bacterium]
MTQMWSFARTNQFLTASASATLLWAMGLWGPAMGASLVPTQEAAQEAAQEAEFAQFSGTVVDEQGRPIAGARVTLYKVIWDDSGTEDGAVGETTTSETGTFCLAVRTDGRHSGRCHEIVIDKAGYAVWGAHWHPDEDFEIRITLGPPVTVAGRVVDEKGAPIAGAEIYALSIVSDHVVPGGEVGSLPIPASTTDENGRFSIARLPQDTQVNLYVCAPGRACTGSQYEVPTGTQPGSATELEITMQPEGVVEGTTVEKGTDKPVPGVKLLVDGLPSDADAAGRFRIGGLATGTMSIRLSPSWEGLEKWNMPIRSVETRAGETTAGVKLELEPGGSVEFVVSDARTLKPLSDAWVELASEESGHREITGGTWTNASGMGRVYVLAKSYSGLKVSKDHYLSWSPEKELTVEQGKATRVEVRLKRMPNVKGLAIDGAGVPVVGATVVWPLVADTKTVASGAFELEYDPATLRDREEPPPVWVLDLTRNLAGTAPVEVDFPVTVTLTPGLTVKGRVVDPDGAPIAGVAIDYEVQDDDAWLDYLSGVTRTQAEGYFEIKGIPSGIAVTIEVGAEGYGSAGHNLEDIKVFASESPGALVEAKEIVLPAPRFSVSGTVVDENGQPVPGAEVWVEEGYDQPGARARAGEDGKYVLSGLCKGVVMIHAESPDGRLTGKNIARAGRTDVTVRLFER